MKDGDKRIILVDGEFAGAVNRVPAVDDLRSNMVRGGTPKKTELTAARTRDLRQLGPPLRERGLLFVGIDVIDGYLTEINVTSPTGIRAVKNFGGRTCRVIWDRIEAKRRVSFAFGAVPWCRLQPRQRRNGAQAFFRGISCRSLIVLAGLYCLSLNKAARRQHVKLSGLGSTSIDRFCCC